MLVTPAAGALADRIGNRPLMVAGLLLQGAGFALIAALATPTVGCALLPALLLAGTGISLVFGTVSNAVLGDVTPAELGLASATNASFRQLGAPFGIAIAAAVFQHAGAFTNAQAFTDGFAPALTVAAGISILGAIVALGVRAPHDTRQSAPTPAPRHEPPQEQTAAFAGSA